MHEESGSGTMSLKTMLGRFAILLAAALLVGIGGRMTVLDAHQATACGVFVGIFTTL